VNSYQAAGQGIYPDDKPLLFRLSAFEMLNPCILVL